MINLLKAAAALAIVWGLSHYTVSKVMGKVAAAAQESAEEFKFEYKPIDIGLFHFDASGLSGSDIVFQPGTAAAATPKPRSRSGIDYGATRYSPPRRTSGRR